MAVGAYQDVKTHQDYRVGWICALPLEMAAAICMLDAQHPPLPQPDSDSNSYTLGQIGQHNVVIGCLPSGSPGTVSASGVALLMRTTFPRLRFGLMVGVGGGAPSEEHDIRLGDVVVSRPEGAYGGVIQYDFGKTVLGGRFVQTGSLNRPPGVLLSAIAKLQAQHMINDSQVPGLLDRVIARYPRRKTSCTYPGMDADDLFDWAYPHAQTGSSAQNVAMASSVSRSFSQQGDWCHHCDRSRLVERPDNRETPLAIHYGLIASANQVMRDGATRERLRGEKGILCFEMEAAGIINDFPCLVIRGICDYADSHKNKDWQPYAAAVAAAYTTELLSFIPVSEMYQDAPMMPSQAPSQRIVPGMHERLYQEDQDELILQLLAFPDMFGRRNNIERHHPRTCNWIMERAEYQNWLADVNGLLWIMGKPGAGKSTLMAFLYNKFQKDEKMRETIRLDFFFNARGTDLQKTPLGLLRSLIYQLFNQDENVRPSVRQLFLEKKIQSGSELSTWQWQRPELESLLGWMLEISAQSSKVLVFVDALDEAGENFGSQIALYFHRLNDTVVSEGGAAKFCISSRHYPIVCTMGGTHVSVEDHNSPDIATFVYDNLHLDGMIGLDADDRSIWLEVRRDLISRARGIFQWVRLVVPLVEKYISDGKSPNEIYMRLQQVPQELDDVYSHILENIIGAEDRPRSLLLFQWICLAERPLSVTELRFALAASELHAHSSGAQRSLGFNLVSNDDRMRRLVKSLSGGLAETVPGSQASTDIVQAIHQSVNDYLMSKGLVQLETWATGHSRHINDIVQRSHGTLFQACLDYILVENIRGALQAVKIVPKSEKNSDPLHTKIPSVARAYASQLVWDGVPPYKPERLSDPPVRQGPEDTLAPTPVFRLGTKKVPRAVPEFEDDIIGVLSWHAPLMCYAIANVFAHASKLPSTHFADQIDQMESMRQVVPLWRESQKVLGKLRDEDHPNNGTNLLHIAAVANAKPLVQYLLQVGSDIDEPDAWDCTALHLAAMSGRDEVVDVLLHAGADLRRRNRNNLTPLAAALRRGYLSTARLMIVRCGKLDTYKAEFERMLGVAAVSGDEALARALLSEANADSNSPRANALQKAARYGHAGIVRVLLDHGADINAAGGINGTALQMSTLYGHEDVVVILLERGADVHATGTYGTALRIARNRNLAQIVSMLGEAGAVR